MSFHWMKHAIQAGPSEPTEWAVFMVLANYADEEGSCFPAVSTIARGCRKSLSSVKRAIKRLEGGGWIERVEIGLGLGHTSQYAIQKSPKQLVPATNEVKMTPNAEAVVLNDQKGSFCTQKRGQNDQSPTPPIGRNQSLNPSVQGSGSAASPTGASAGQPRFRVGGSRRHRPTPPAPSPPPSAVPTPDESPAASASYRPQLRLAAKRQAASTRRFRGSQTSLPLQPGDSVDGRGLSQPGNGISRSRSNTVHRPLDERFEELANEIRTGYWAAMVSLVGKTPAQIPCIWDNADKAALSRFLRSLPGESVESIRTMMGFRWDSCRAGHVNPVEMPRNFLKRLAEFRNGPLDRFFQPLKIWRQA